MNQILVTKKLYVTPELKRKKKIYKFDFILSIFIVIVLISVYIYAEYDRNKTEETSQEILEEMKVASQENQKEKKDDKTVAKDNSVLLIVLDDVKEGQNAVDQELAQEETPKASVNNEIKNTQLVVKTTSDGYRYKSVATINIPKIDVNYPILEGETGSVEETDSLLKISPCKFWGPQINEVGNYCIVGHNWRNTKFFSKVPTLENGDTFTITEPNGRQITYKVYDKYEVEPQNVSCTSQITGGKKEVTLITCNYNSERRVIIKSREVK